MKKILALILAFAMVFSTIIVAFAEEEVSAEAKALAIVGMLEGDGSGVTAEYTAKEMTRFTAAISLLKLKGLYTEALAFEGEANFEDVDSVKWEEGKNILAYLKANPELGFGGNEKGEFNPYGNINEQSYYKVLLETLGYKQTTNEVVGDFAWDETLAFAEEVGLKPAKTEKFTVDELAKATVAALKAKMKDGKVLINVLVDQGKIDKAKAVAADLYEEVNADVKSAKALGNSVVEVTFKEAINEAAENVDNYAIEGLEIKSALVTGEKVVRLTTSAMTSGKLYTLVAGDVKVKFTGIGKVSDAPKIKAATSTDVDEVVVTFDKVLDYETATDAGNYTISGVEVVSVELDEDEVTLTTSGLVNKKQYTVKASSVKSIDGSTSKSTTSKSFYTRFDLTPPAVEKIEVETNERVVVYFKEEVTAETAEDLANYTIKTGTTELEVLEAKLVEDDDDEMTIVELTTESQKANAKYELAISNISDTTKSGNKMVKTVKKVFYGMREDKAVPVLKEAVVLSRNHIQVTFTDKSRMDETTLLDANNYTVTRQNKDKDDVAVEKAEEVDFDDGVYKVLLTVDDLEVGNNYELVAESIADEFGNVLEKNNKRTVAVTRDSVASSTIEKITFESGKKIKVYFTKPLESASAKDIGNYKFNKDLGSPIKASYSDKVVTLTTNEMTKDVEYKLTLGDVHDLAGNNLSGLNKKYIATAGDVDEDAPEYVSVYSLNKHVVAVSFDEEVDYEEGTKLVLKDGTTEYTLYAKALTEDDTVIEFSNYPAFKLDKDEYTVVVAKSLKGVKDASKAANPFEGLPTDYPIVVYGNEEDVDAPEVNYSSQKNGVTFEVSMSKDVEIVGVDSNFDLELDEDDENIVYFTKKSGIIKEVEYKVNLANLLADKHGVKAVNVEDTYTVLYGEYEDDESPYVVSVTATDRYTVEVEFSEDMKTTGSYQIKNADSDAKVKSISISDMEIDENIVILTLGLPLESRYDYDLYIKAKATDLANNKSEEAIDDVFSFAGTDLAPVLAAAKPEEPKPVIDKTALNAAIALAEAKVEAEYTAESWAPFALAKEAANAIAAKADATQAEVDGALAALNAKMGALAKKPVEKILTAEAIGIPTNVSGRVTAGITKVEVAYENTTYVAVLENGLFYWNIFGLKAGDKITVKAYKGNDIVDTMELTVPGDTEDPEDPGDPENPENPVYLLNVKAVGNIATSVTGSYESTVTKVEVIFTGFTKEARLTNGSFIWNIFPGMNSGDKVIVKAYVGSELVETLTVVVK